MFIVYEHVSPTGKRYIGQTSQRLSRRWRDGDGYVRNEALYQDIQRYGWDSFEHNILQRCETFEEAIRVEADMIAKFRSNDPERGYNISGGCVGPDCVAASTREKLSAAHKGRFAGEKNPNYGRKHTQEEREKISAYLLEYYKTHPNPRRGAKASDEARARMSESRRNSEKAKACILALNKSKAKRVRCNETGMIYESTREVERVLGFRQGNIAAACRGKYKQAYGFHWEYV